jgi:selT/selW/selH-like putative selenoprotein
MTVNKGWRKMQVKIEYCRTCNYRPIAAALARTLKDETGLDSVLVESTSGAFEVYLDDTLVFSKLLMNQFPNHENIINSVKNLVGG